MKPDPIEILVQHQTAALIRHGAKVEEARAEAEGIVETMLNDLEKIGLRDVQLGVALRRARVYRLRCQGVSFRAICERLAIHRVTAQDYYRHELMRRRAG